MNIRKKSVRNAIIWGIAGLCFGAAISGLKGGFGIGVGTATVAYCMPPTASGTGDWSPIQYLPWSTRLYASILFLGFLTGLSVGTDPLPDATIGVIGMAIIYPMSYWIQLKPW
jgi:hypothetical protein